MLQTKEGQPAKGVTEEEFINFLRRAEKAFYDKLRRMRDVWEQALGPCPFPDQQRQRFELASMPPGGWPGDWSPIWSFDKPNIHGGKEARSVMAALKWDAADIFQLPVRSSDIHKVIEHTHSRLVRAFDDWYYVNLTEYPLSKYKEKLEELFYHDPSVASASVIFDDVNSLPHTYRQVVERHGGEIPKAFR